MVRTISRAALALVMVFLLAACAPETKQAWAERVSSDQERSSAAQPDAPPAAASAAPSDGTSLVEGAGAARSVLTIDGKDCADGAENVWLKRAADDVRWTLYLDSPRCDVSLQVAGVIDRPYPQSGVIAWEGQEYIKVFARDVNSQYSNSFTLSHLSAPGAEDTIAIGPTGSAAPTRILARGRVAVWGPRAGEGLPPTREIVVDVTTAER